MTGACVHPNLTEESSVSPRTNTKVTASIPSDDDIKSALSCRKRRSQIIDTVNSEGNLNLTFSSDDIHEISIESPPTSSGIVTPDRDTSDPLRDSKKARTGKQEEDNFSCDLMFDGPKIHEVNSNESRVKMAQVLPASLTSPPFDPTAMKEHIAKVSSDALKKLPHRKGSNPVADFAEHLPNENAAMKLFEGIKPTCNTPQMTRWELSSNEDINSWLEKKDQYIHPVEAGEWFIDWFTVYNPLYAWAKFHSCEATFDKKTDRLTLTFKSELFATGKDEHGKFRSMQ